MSSVNSVREEMIPTENAERTENIKEEGSVSSVKSVGEEMIPTEHAECTENITRRRFSEFSEFRGRRNEPHRTRRMHRKYYKKKVL